MAGKLRGAAPARCLDRDVGRTLARTAAQGSARPRGLRDLRADQWCVMQGEAGELLMGRWVRLLYLRVGGARGYCVGEGIWLRMQSAVSE